MSLQKDNKIQHMLQSWPEGTVATAAWLAHLGISRQLRNKYLQSGWITSVSHSAYQKKGDSVGWQGALYALQAQMQSPVHVGALTALTMQGMAHYVRMGGATVFLFAPAKTLLPAWFKKHDWGEAMHYIATSVFPVELGLVKHDGKTFSIRISGLERAFLECLHLAPNTMDLMECYHIMEGLTTLRPKLLQQLLEQCTSIKVKRLFLYMATKAGHDWVRRLDHSKLELGRGSRTIAKGGVYVAEFGITVPEELEKR
ncbi:type IV toxin-antitoxin system AbiEi family antitoxin [Paremcibacter congregatus]|uniref:type IV toxin-antitoxin system AbiEi family antitoxin n=1 Tax=Paremcibacter congregatus TaxID=2043170 RepID=UPI003A8D9616